MPVTGTNNLPAAVVRRYLREYVLHAYGNEVWAQFVDWQSMPEGNSGSSFDFPALVEMEPAIDALDEETDIVPVRFLDDQLVVTPAEYGNASVINEAARFRSRIDLRDGNARQIGQNRTRSVERIIRNAVLGGSNVVYPGTNAARTDLTGSGDQVTFAFLKELHARAATADIEPIGKDGLFMAPIHHLLVLDIQALDEYKEVQYRRPVNLQNKEIYGGFMPFIFAGFHFIPHKWGKVYQSGGTVAQAATTLAAAAAAGDTSIEVASASGIVAGDFVTIETLEATKAETVKVTVVASTTLTIAGSGSKASNNGLKYAHASGVAVTEGAFAAAIPVIGRNSIKGVYGENVGRLGTVVLQDSLDVLKRFVYQGWKWHGGVSVWNRYVVRAEVALSTKVPMAE